MRTTWNKTAADRIVGGDPALAEALAAALAHTDPVDRYTHGFHTWPAGLHPDAARDLVAAFPGDVLDPFCGGGTVLVEARVAGRTAVGRDLSPIAVRVATARAATPDEPTVARMRAQARRLTEEARHAQDLPPDDLFHAIRDWYAPHAILELERLRRGLGEVEPAVRPLLEVVFSAILVKTSWRASDTQNRRERHHRPPGTAAILFHKKARELGRRLEALRAAVPAGTPDADVRLGDARAIRCAPVDLVLTSPPYPATYDYLPMQHLRRIWLGLSDDEPAEIGARRHWRQGHKEARRRWADDTAAWTKSAAAALRTGGHLVVVVGDGSTPDGTVDAAETTVQAARAAGLVPRAQASLLRDDYVRQSKRWEHVFAFRKEAS